MPFSRVAIAAEDHGAVFVHDLFDRLEGRPVQGGAGHHAALQTGRPTQPMEFGEAGAERDQRSGHGLSGTHRTKLEAIAREGEGRGAVAIAGVLGKFGQGVDSQAHQPD